MLTCQEVTEKASQNFDGELGFRDRIAERAHLMMCAKCRLFYRQFKALVMHLSGGIRAESDPPSPEFVQQVVTDIEAARETSAHNSESNNTQ